MFKKVILIAILAMSAHASADIVQLTAVPTAWKLENYLNAKIVVWYGGSSCRSGLLTFSSTIPAEDKKLFWSTVMAAKISQQPLFVRYENSVGNCPIVSFGLPQET